MTAAFRRFGSRVDREALTIWLATRAAVAIVSLAALWMVTDGTAGEVPSWLASWDRWDTGLFVKIAHFGYQGRPAHYPDAGVVAFFPGEPLALRAVHVVVGNWVGAGLLISLVAGAVASVALGRLGALDGGATVASRSVLYLALSPYAVFLAAAYSEALFLAFALPAWLAARRSRWAWAGVLGALAATVRITGLFLAVALVVQWIVGRQPGRQWWRDGAWLLLPFAAIAGYFGYLRAITGDWLAWQHAQQDNWGRSMTAPWTALRTTWHAARDPSLGGAYVWSFRAEIVAVLVGLLVTVALVIGKRWAESVYVGGQVLALATSSYYLSVARATLLWFPLWLMLARASTRIRWVHPVYLAVAPALMVVGVVSFTQGHWVG